MKTLIKWKHPLTEGSLTQYYGFAPNGDRYGVTLGIPKNGWGLSGESYAEITFKPKIGKGKILEYHVCNVETCKAYAEKHAQSNHKGVNV